MPGCEAGTSSLLGFGKSLKSKKSKPAMSALVPVDAVGPFGNSYGGCVDPKVMDGPQKQFPNNKTSWWFQPMWTILVKLDHFPK